VTFPPKAGRSIQLSYTGIYILILNPVAFPPKAGRSISLKLHGHIHKKSDSI
jgi:hypothetical protein